MKNILTKRNLLIFVLMNLLVVLFSVIAKIMLTGSVLTAFMELSQDLIRLFFHLLVFCSFAYIPSLFILRKLFKMSKEDFWTMLYFGWLPSVILFETIFKLW